MSILFSVAQGFLIGFLCNKAGYYPNAKEFWIVILLNAFLTVGISP
jgi:hypothetical protein